MWWAKDAKAAQHPQEELQWFADAGRPYDNGASFPNFLKNLRADALKTLSDAERQSLADAIAAYTPPGDPRRRPPVAPRTKVVKEWTTADLAPTLDQAGKGRNFRRGREAYEAAQCAACHRIGSEGGSIGPDLAAISSRFKRQDILEAMTEPSKVVSEQYANTAVVTKKNGTVIGRVLEENDDKIVILPDPLKPESKVEVKKADGNITRRQLSKTSPMPEGLINVLSKEEILDLIAYMESGGRRDHPAFAQPN
jgi:putative heme-binding domain-containing protein